MRIAAVEQNAPARPANQFCNSICDAMPWSWQDAPDGWRSWSKQAPGPMPQCVKATLGDRLDTSSTQCRKVGWELMSTAVLSAISFGSLEVCWAGVLVSNNLCLRIGYPLLETHRLRSVGWRTVQPGSVCLADSADVERRRKVSTGIGGCRVEQGPEIPSSA